MKLAVSCIGGALLICSMLSACNRGEGTGGIEPAARVRFTAAPQTLFSSGAMPFQIAPSLREGESVTCMLDGNVIADCLSGAAGGAIDYANLLPGRHELSVMISDATDSAASYEHEVEVVHADVVIYGATPGGITAAIAAAQSGKRAAILEPTPWIGGMMSGGLAKTDLGPRGIEVLGGLEAEFFARTRAIERRRGACSGNCASLFDFEPQVGEQVFEGMVAEYGVIIERNVRLAAVAKEGNVIRSLMTERGEVPGRVFIDASYEGDLMAMANIPYAIGRERRRMTASADELPFQEDYAGVGAYEKPRGVRVDPYVVPGDASSGTLPFVAAKPNPLPMQGDADDSVMAYTYRLCVTDDPSNRLPFSAPPNYDPAQYEVMARVALARVQAGANLAQEMFNPAPTVASKDRAYLKYDLNGGSTFSIDMTAGDLNQRYVEADENERQRIREAYRSYASGLLYFWQTDPRFGPLNAKIARFGYCADEFVARGGWPQQLYVREARRMQGAYVMYEADVLQNGRREPIADGIGFGAYDIDTHTHHYVAAPARGGDVVVAEGFQIVHLPDDRPYPVSYRALIPKAEDAVNFLNPVTLSATHVAYASLRLEPTFMILGEAAGVAAAIAADRDIAVQEVPYRELRQRLLERGQRLAN